MVQPEKKVSGCMDLIILAVISFVVVSAVFIRHLIVLGVSITPEDTKKIAIVGAGIQFFLLILILTPLSIFWPSPRKAIYRGWLIGALMTLLLAPAYFISEIRTSIQAVYQTLIMIIILGALIMVRRRSEGDHNPKIASILEIPISAQLSSWIPFALMIVVVSYGWLVLGAVGSLLDTILMLFTALLLGAIAAFIFQTTIFLPSIQVENEGKFETVINGIAASTTIILLIGSLSFSFGGIQLLAILCAAGLGWVLSIHHSTRSRSSLSEQETEDLSKHPTLIGWQIAALIGLLISLPLIFLDPEEMTLLLNASPGEILGKGIQASMWSAGIVGISVFILAAQLIRSRNSHGVAMRNSPGSRSVRMLPLQLLVFLFALGAGIFLYFQFGQPGFFGEKLFIVFRDQADLSQIDQIADPDARRAAVYEELVKVSNLSQADIRSFLDRLGIAYTPYYLVNGLVIADRPLIRLWLESRPEVDRILMNPMLRPLPTTPPVQSGELTSPDNTLWNISMVGADKVWQDFGVRGAGIIIGQSDSGVNGEHPELTDSYRGKDSGDDYSWLDPWNLSTSPVDIGGHGTHTLGTILGNQTGLAPDSEWIACVNLARNLGNPAHYLDCMQFMLAPYPQAGNPFTDGKPELGADILNNSWGCPEIEGCDSSIFAPAVEALKSSGIYVVVSAGNDGPKCGSLKDPPAIYPEVLSVGAVEQSGQLAYFSSVGPFPAALGEKNKPDLVAPGVSVVSSMPENTYAEMSGTSMAGPHVAGAVALMWSANPDLIGEIDLTTRLLIESADPYPFPQPDCPGTSQIPSTASGYGILNAYKAVESALDSKIQ